MLKSNHDDAPSGSGTGLSPFARLKIEQDAGNGERTNLSSRSARPNSFLKDFAENIFQESHIFCEIQYAARCLAYWSWCRFTIDFLRP
jgi:hypothetical protein